MPLRAEINPSVLPSSFGIDAGMDSRLSREEQAFLHEKGKISMCVDPNWMPLEMIDRGKHIGIAADYMTLLSTYLGVPIALVPTRDWTQSLEFAKHRQCDILSLVMPTPERLEYMAFSRPYLSLPLVLATHYREPFVADITLITDKKLAVVKGYAFGEILRKKYPELHFTDVDSELDGLNRVEQGEFYGFIGSLTTVGYALQNSYPELKIAGKFDERWELGVGVRNDQPLLLAAFEKAIASVGKRQTQDILNRWISVKYEKAVDLDSLWQGLLIFGLLLLFLLYRQRMLKQHNKELLNLTRTDALTGIASRHYLDLELDRLVFHYQRYTEIFSIMAMDLDNFKEVNDRFGHPAGDRVLIEFVSLVKQHLRKTDLFGRWGGEEFLVICPHTSLDQVEMLAERIRNAIAQHRFEVTGSQTVSIGIATCEQLEMSPARLVSNADKALYAAKAAGRNRVAR